MMPERICTPDGIVYGMRYPREGVPVARVEIKECPPQKPKADRADIRIIQNVFTVVPFRYEIIPNRGQINRNRDDGNKTRKVVCELICRSHFHPSHFHSVLPKYIFIPVPCVTIYRRLHSQDR